MFYNWQRRFAYWNFGRQVAGVYQSSSIRTVSSGLRIVTRLAHNDLPMYLLAIGSLYRAIGEGDVLVLNDGSLTAEDERVLRRQIPGVELIQEAGIETGRCPKGGCWERLMMILDLCSQSYIIQLDADTLTLGGVDEVVACYRANRSFVLRDARSQKLTTFEESSALARKMNSQHLQVAVERRLEQMQGASTRLYARGSAGFSGFARGCSDRASVEEFSAEIGRLVGEDRWAKEWGSEQIASNYVVANSPQAELLPYPKYACFGPELDYSQSTFLHFYGTYRFQSGVYGRLAKQVLKGTLLG